jgi:hypothetical protein
LPGTPLDPHGYRALVALADFATSPPRRCGSARLVLLVASGAAARRAVPGDRARGAGRPRHRLDPRAIAAFPSLASVVHTSYGQALLVKTGILVAVLAVAWLNRKRIARLGLGAELALLAGLVVAVAVLTDLRPPPRAAASARPVLARPKPPPSTRSCSAARTATSRSASPASPRGKRIAARVTALGPDGYGVDGLRVRVGATTRPCGPGCYATTIPLPRHRARSTWPSRARCQAGDRSLHASAPLARAQCTALVTCRPDVPALRTLVIHEHLASSSRNAIDTTYELPLRTSSPTRSSTARRRS